MTLLKKTNNKQERRNDLLTIYCHCKWLLLPRLQATNAELLYLLNFTSVVCLPFIALLFGELSALEAQLANRRTLELICSLFVMVSMAFLQFFGLAGVGLCTLRIVKYHDCGVF